MDKQKLIAADTRFSPGDSHAIKRQNLVCELIRHTGNTTYVAYHDIHDGTTALAGHNETGRVSNTMAD